MNLFLAEGITVVDHLKGRINIMGAGAVGRTLGALWSQSGVLQVGEVLNRSLDSGQQAVDFMGAGRAVSDASELQSADFYLLACPDDQIESCCQQLVNSGVLLLGAVVLHCSGAISSALLSSAAEQGALVASMHPVRSFAGAVLAVEQFSGTYCGLEGDAEAVRRLDHLMESIGGIGFSIDPMQKAVYHAASVMACNYLVVLQEVSLQALEHSGVERELGMKILRPLVEGTVTNVFELGTSEALTGPIARGDSGVVAAQLTALEAWRPEVADLYRGLGREAL